jgi:hypothetical protein
MEPIQDDIEEMRRAIAGYGWGSERLLPGFDRLVAERDRLQSEIDRLTEALGWMLHEHEDSQPCRGCRLGRHIIDDLRREALTTEEQG